jgi:hypothetical protein
MARRIFSFGSRPAAWGGMVAGRVLDPRGTPGRPRRTAQGAALARIRLPTELHISTASGFRATALPIAATASPPGGRNIPARAWDLSGLKERYEEFATFAGLLRDQTEPGGVSVGDAFVARTRVMDECRELFIACYDLLGPLATRRVRQIIALYRPKLAGRAAYHTTELIMSDAGD